MQRSFFLLVPFSGFGKKSKSLWEEEGEVGYCNQLPAYDPPVSSIESQEGAMWLQQHWLLLVGCLIVPTWIIDLDLVPEFACTFPFSCPALSQVLGQKYSHPITSINSISNLIWVFFPPILQQFLTTCNVFEPWYLSWMSMLFHSIWFYIILKSACRT